MGGFCTTGTENLPTYENVLTGTDIPEWVSAGGKILFEQAGELAKSPYPGYQGARIASYDGDKLTPEEQQAFNMLTSGATSYQPYVDKAYQAATRLGRGYDEATRAELMGPGYRGATRGQLAGGSAPGYRGMTSSQLIGRAPDITGYTGPMGRQGGLTRGELVGDYQGATREQLTGPGFTLESAQPFLDIYQGAADPAVREVERQIAAQQTANRAQAARAGAFGGSRAAISDILTASEGAARAGDIRSQATQQGLGFAAQQFEADRAARFGAEQALSAQAERDRAARFAAESDLYGRFAQDRAFGAEMSMADRAARMEQAERDRQARFGAEQAGRSAYETQMAQRERDRAARFGAEDVLRQRYQQDREARFGAEAAQRAAYETQEASRLRQAEQLQSYAPLIQGLQEQAASGMLSAGEARRKLDQMALDLAYSDYVEQREYPFQMLNFAMGALKGVPYETTQYSLSQGQQYVQTPSIYGQTLGGLGALASAYYMSQGR
jgi:hypothetical protein